MIKLCYDLTFELNFYRTNNMKHVQLGNCTSVFGLYQLNLWALQRLIVAWNQKVVQL